MERVIMMYKDKSGGVWSISYKGGYYYVSYPFFDPRIKLPQTLTHSPEAATESLELHAELQRKYRNQNALSL